METLKRLRKERGLNQIDLAKLLNISVSAYGNYELDQREPNIESLTKLADFYGVSIDYLVGRKKESSVKWAGKEHVLGIGGQTLEWTDEDRALGIREHHTAPLSGDDWEWLELKNEALRLKGEDYYEMLKRMIKAAIEIK